MYARMLHGRRAEVAGPIISTVVYGADAWLGVVTRTNDGAHYGHLLEPDDEFAQWREIVGIGVIRGGSRADVEQALLACLEAHWDSKPVVARVFPAAPRPERGTHLQPHPRFGRSNPERIDDPCWSWAIGQGINGYALDQELLLDREQARPLWSFDRFGMSRTTLADGRIICVAGEHEDFYDDDFNIYNDVIVLAPGKLPEVYAYPVSDFAPTDFHSATLVGDELVLIGSAGYVAQREPGRTPIHVLDLRTFAIRRRDASGDVPGWICKHDARFDPMSGCIHITGGVVSLDGGRSAGNAATFELDLATWTWRRAPDGRSLYEEPR